MLPSNPGPRAGRWVKCHWAGWLVLVALAGCAQPQELSPEVPAGPEAASPPDSDDVSGIRGMSLRLSCLDDSVVEPFSDSSTRAVVFVFISTDCPIANAYLPQLKQMRQRYSQQGVSFFLVHSTAGMSDLDARSHARKYELTIPVVMDPNQVLARRMGAEVTPEAFVLERGSAEPVYRGAIDNLYADYGKRRVTATEKYLQAALEDLLAGMDILRPVTKPVGCFISYDR